MTTLASQLVGTWRLVSREVTRSQASGGSTQASGLTRLATAPPSGADSMRRWKGQRRRRSNEGMTLGAITATATPASLAQIEALVNQLL
ncbi:MAG TPA: hypothetical protein VIJ58_11520 [Candidatus Dormibacteraeota bacterium]